MFNSIFHQNLDVAKTNMFLVVPHPSSSLFLRSLTLRSFTAEETWFPMYKSQPRPIPGTENYLSSHVQAATSEPRLSTTWTLSTATATFTQTPKPKSQFSESWSCRCSADFPRLGLKATQTVTDVQFLTVENILWLGLLLCTSLPPSTSAYLRRPSLPPSCTKLP